MRKFSYGFVLVAAGCAMAQDADPPSRVARLNLINGPVSFRPGSVEDWGAATLNYPLTTGDHLWADDGAYAELHIGSTAIRMNAATALAVLNLDDRVAQLSLTQGAIDVHVRFIGEQETYEVDTPNVAITLLRPGDYRINADGDNNVTVAAVRAGQAEVTGGGQAFSISPAESTTITGTDQIGNQMGPEPPPDQFDQWCIDRDRRESSTVSARYVPRETIGYEDLDQYGVWRNVPPYGYVWMPTAVPPGWAPYKFGHWAWVEPWGWTWVDDAPWGFAPFHYGRWAFAAGAWVWVPGRLVAGARPVYAPALVAFVGGPGFAVGVGVGGGVGMAGWFPLGPGEVYRPAYAVSPAYVTSINIVHVGNVTVINNMAAGNVRYVNQGVPGAMVVVPREAFVGARPVGMAAVVVPRGQFVNAQVIGAAPPIAPTRVSLGVAAGANVHAPPARFADRAIVARTAPPPPPVSFAAREQELRANPGRPLEPARVNALRASAPAARPMVRSVDAGGHLSRPAGAPGVSGQPAVNTNRPMNNDRPSSARPSYSNPQPAEHPANTGERNRPAVNEPAHPAAATGNTPNTEHPANANEKTQPRKDTRKSAKKTEK
ncbi:MAG: DUF6600 domain-containing protein [Bryobacteraceae bacterium]|jgi:hypothetical protein